MNILLKKIVMGLCVLLTCVKLDAIKIYLDNEGLFTQDSFSISTINTTWEELNERIRKKYRKFNIEMQHLTGKNRLDAIKDLSVISREIRRNSKNSVYECEQVQIKAAFRRKNIQKTRITSDQINEVVSLIAERQWSHEQISGRIKLGAVPSPSHEWIYQHIWKDERQGGTLYQTAEQANMAMREQLLPLMRNVFLLNHTSHVNVDLTKIRMSLFDSIFLKSLISPS